MKLVQLPENPMPNHAKVGMCETDDGVKLRYAIWKTASPKFKGTVIILGGRSEYIEKNYQTTTDLAQNGFDVLSFDWRGQGGSSRLVRDEKLGYIENFKHYEKDLETIFQNVALPDCRAPYYILGHSTGSLVALMAAPLLKNQVQRMVLGSPLLGLANIPISQKLLKYFTATLHVLGLGRTYLLGGKDPLKKRTFENNKLTSDEDRFNRIKQFSETFPNLTIGGPSASWIFAAIRAMDSVNEPEYAAKVTIPTLMICGSNDHIVDNSKAETFGSRLRSGTTLTITGAKHELLQEKDIYREQFLSAFYAFVPGSDVDKEKKSPTPKFQHIQNSKLGT